jgi:hypothetical protein
MFGIGISFASFRRFWAVAARRNSLRTPFGPRSRSRSSLRMRLRWANSISTFLRSRRDIRPSSDLAICRAISRAPSWMERGTFPRWSIRTAPELESASRAVVFAGAVEHRCMVIHQSARGGQLLAAVTKVAVTHVVIGEVVTTRLPALIAASASLPP